MRIYFLFFFIFVNSLLANAQIKKKLLKYDKDFSKSPLLTISLKKRFSDHDTQLQFLQFVSDTHKKILNKHVNSYVFKQSVSPIEIPSTSIRLKNFKNTQVKIDQI